MTTLSFELITPEGAKIQEEVYEVTLPTPGGQVSILPHHVPLISIASTGVISVRRREQDPDSLLEHFASEGGIVEIDGKRVRLLADFAEHAGDVDELRAKEALEKAQEMRKTATDQVSLADATRLIERNLARLKVAELKKRRREGRTG